MEDLLEICDGLAEQWRVEAVFDIRQVVLPARSLGHRLVVRLNGYRAGRCMQLSQVDTDGERPALQVHPLVGELGLQSHLRPLIGVGRPQARLGKDILEVFEYDLGFADCLAVVN